MIFHGIAVKPGKPTAFGRIGGKPVLGMPGYPTSCLSNAYMLLVPLLRRMARLPEYQPHTVRAAAGPPHRLDDRPAPVLHGADRGRRRGAGVQGLRRHHQHGAGRRLHRDPRPDRHRRSGRARRREAVLMQLTHRRSTTRAAVRAADTEGRAAHRSRDFLAKGPVLLAFHRGTW